MHSISWEQACVKLQHGCVIILTASPTRLWFLLSFVYLWMTKTQVAQALCAGQKAVLTSFMGGLYTLTTGPITTTNLIN